MCLVFLRYRQTSWRRFIFFFKQKPAYEMRISVWSSDVCASDLSPSDGTQFLAQTAQFTMVEKLTEMTELTQSLLSDNQALAAASMLGCTVSWADADGNIQSGVVSGATFGSKGASVLVGEQTIALSEIRDVRATDPTTTTPETDSADTENEAPETEATDGTESTDGTDAVDAPAGTDAPGGPSAPEGAGAPDGADPATDQSL